MYMTEEENGNMINRKAYILLLTHFKIISDFGERVEKCILRLRARTRTSTYVVLLCRKKWRVQRPVLNFAPRGKL
jgi:hypothetical protein